MPFVLFWRTSMLPGIILLPPWLISGRGTVLVGMFCLLPVIVVDILLLQIPLLLL